MKRIHRITQIALIVLLVSCRGSDKKETPASTDKTDTGVHINNNNRPGEEKAPDQAPAAKPSNDLTGNNEILAHIDQYLVSKVNNGTVTVQNTLKDITIQKAIAEVVVLAADGSEIGNYFPVLQNIEPGDIETVKIPANSRAANISCHIVKLKSAQLTNGEMKMVGTHYNGN